MAHSKTGLLSPTELRDLYGIPLLNDAERREYFTFDQAELNILTNFKDVKDSVYFAIALVFFKLKHTLTSNSKCNSMLRCCCYGKELSSFNT